MEVLHHLKFMAEEEEGVPRIDSRGHLHYVE